jgi:hypothetical protein
VRLPDGCWCSDERAAPLSLVRFQSASPQPASCVVPTAPADSVAGQLAGAHVGCGHCADRGGPTGSACGRTARGAPSSSNAPPISREQRGCGRPVDRLRCVPRRRRRPVDRRPTSATRHSGRVLRPPHGSKTRRRRRQGAVPGRPHHRLSVGTNSESHIKVSARYRAGRAIGYG